MLSGDPNIIHVEWVCQCLLMCVLIVSGGYASAGPAAYSITLEKSAGAAVGRREECNSDIGSGGGDLIEAGVRYRGQCEGAGIAPQIVREGGARYLKFATDPAYQGETRTRSELALTSRWFRFGEPVYVGFRIQIPEGAAKTRDFFYVMQFWQCPGASPIAGIRISRGHSHRINFMTRGDSRAGSMAAYKLHPDTWTSFVIKAVVDAGDGRGSFAVWHDPDVEPEVYRGRYGYSENGTCVNHNQPPQRFRIKFGIYKGNESGKRYEVDYDDVRIGNDFDSVSPWIRR